MSQSIGFMNYQEEGVYDVEKVDSPGLFTASSLVFEFDNQLKVNVTVTKPKLTQPMLLTDEETSKYPMVFFFSGVQARANSYESYARHLASWGYIVLQLDYHDKNVFFDIGAKDTAMVEYLDDLVEQLKEHQQAKDFLRRHADWGSVVAAGHGRGGNMAALAYAKYQAEQPPGGGLQLKAFFMVDPVSQPVIAADGIRALKRLHQNGTRVQAGVIGAGARVLIFEGMFHRPGMNFQDFRDVLDKGSWACEVKRATHLDFCIPAGNYFVSLEKAFDVLLELMNPMRAQDAINLALGPMTAWFQLQLGKDLRAGEWYKAYLKDNAYDVRPVHYSWENWLSVLHHLGGVAVGSALTLLLTRHRR